jgi:hypothetical protein
MGKLGIRTLHRWKFWNLALLIVASIVAAFMLTFPQFSLMIGFLGEFGYLGAFLAGFLYAYSLTVPISVATLFLIAKHLNPTIIAVLGGIGAMTGDYLIFRFVRDRIIPETELLLKRFNVDISSIAAKYPKLVSRIAPLIAGIIIASPLPDEVGIALLGSVKYEVKKFLILTFSLNSAGIFIITHLALVL